MKRSLLIIAAYVLAAASVQAAPRDAKDLVRDLRAVTHRERRLLPFEEINHARLVALLPQALELEQKPDDLWQPIPSDDFPDYPGIRLFNVLHISLRAAACSAPSDAEKERWLRQELEMVKRMLQAPRTRRVYAERRDEQKSTSDYVSVLRILSLELPAVKDTLKHFRFLRADEWTVVYGVTVIDEPGAVVVREGKPHLSPRTLSVLGLPGAGSSPVSVEELVRRRTVEAEVQEGSQIVELRPVPVRPRRSN